MANYTANNDGDQVSPIFVQFKKNNPKVATYFGASLRSTGGKESVHSMADVDYSGLAWKVGFRNDDVIEAVNATKTKTNNVSHGSLIEFLRECGRTCNMLVRRGFEEQEFTYDWLAFRLKQDKRTPAVAKRVKRSVGSDINHAEKVHERLPRWALRTTASTDEFHYEDTKRVYVVRNERNGDRYLDFYVTPRRSHAEPKFTTNTFVLNMNIYSSIDDSTDGTVVAFSAVPRRSQSNHKASGCFGSKDDDDDDDDDDSRIGGEACLAGDQSGAMTITDFPSWMTDSRRRIMSNSRMLITRLNTNQTELIQSANSDTELYVIVCGDVAWLGRRGSEFSIQDAPAVPTRSSLYPSLQH